MFKSPYKFMKTLQRDLTTSFGTDISTPAARRRAYLHFHLLDHGILRSFWSNLAQISPGVWRSNQPSPKRLRKYKRMGIKTILNLRGENGKSPYLFEREACTATGLTLVNRNMNARALVPAPMLLDLLEKFETIERPFVMHCKSGADRAGLASALYLLHMENLPVTEAKKQLSIRFLHLRSFRTGILDHFLDAYEHDQKTDPLPIRTWIETRYDRDTLTAEFNAKRART